MAEIFIKIQLEQLENGAYLATSDDVPGLVAQGRTVAETLEIAQDVTRKLIESYIEHGDELPPQWRRHRPEKLEIDIPVGVSAWDD
jgi:predicted RNase H-like HicB family nuclease